MAPELSHQLHGQLSVPSESTQDSTPVRSRTSFDSWHDGSRDRQGYGLGGPRSKPTSSVKLSGPNSVRERRGACKVGCRLSGGRGRRAGYSVGVRCCAAPRPGSWGSVSVQPRSGGGRSSSTKVCPLPGGLPVWSASGVCLLATATLCDCSSPPETRWAPRFPSGFRSVLRSLSIWRG